MGSQSSWKWGVLMTVYAAVAVVLAVLAVSAAGVGANESDGARGWFSAVGVECVARPCQDTCIPDSTKAWGNCCNHTDTCRFDNVFQDFRCIPQGKLC